MEIKKTEIEKTILIEDLINIKSGAVKFLMEKGIKCLVCGEPVWGTLEDSARQKGFGDNDIEKFVKELNEIE